MADNRPDRSHAGAGAGAPGPSGQQQMAGSGTQRRQGTTSHNRVWINPNFQARTKTGDSGLSDAELLKKMGLGSDPQTQNTPQTTTPPPNQFGKRPKGPTPASKPAAKKSKKGKRRVTTAAQQRLEHARATQGANKGDQTGANNIPDGDAGSESQTEDEGRDRKRAKKPELARLMGGSRAVVQQLEEESLDEQPRWLKEQAEKRKSKLFPPKPTNVAKSLLDLADKLASETERQICRAAAVDIESAVSALHGQADGRVEGVLDEVHNLQKKFEDAMADATRQSKKQCMEFWSKCFVSTEGYVSNTDLFRRLNLTLMEKHGITIPAREVCDLHPLRRKRPGTIIVKFADRKEGSAFHFLSSPWLLPKNNSAIQMTMDLALSPYDANIRDALIWWKNRCTFMRGTAALRGYNPDKVVPPTKWVMAVKSSATPGLVEAKFPNPKGGRKAYKFDVIATYSQLKSLMGQTSFDRYLLGGESDRWDLPKRIERDLEYEKKKKQGNPESSTKEKESEEQSGGLRDDSLPETADQILPDEDVEEEDDDVDEEAEDETSRMANEAQLALQMETDNSKE